MSYKIKFTYIIGRTLTYSVRKPDGTLKGLANRPLTETPPSSGYYTNNDILDIAVGDVVIIKDSATGNNVGSGEWKSEDVNQLSIPSTGNRLWNYFLDLYERTLKAFFDSFLGKFWPK